MTLDNTLRDLSVSATLLTNRADNEYQNLNNPDECHQTTRLANKQMVWLLLATEEVNKFREAGTTTLCFQSLHGSIRLPQWDKLILSTSPAAALATWYCHAVEHHLVTSNKTELVLLSWEVNTLQQMQRISSGCINIFSRGYTYPQMQLEAGRVFNMLPSEKASNSMPATAALMKQHLGRQHHLVICNIGQIQVKDIFYNGQKTAERIRCNVDAKTWADSADIRLYNTEIEEHQREGLMDTGIESNMEEGDHDVHQD